MGSQKESHGKSGMSKVLKAVNELKVGVREGELGWPMAKEEEGETRRSGGRKLA